MVKRVVMAIACGALTASFSARAQVVIQPGVTFEVRAGTNALPRQDPLLNLMLSQPPIDTSELLALAEFDPPVVAMGQRATYRVILTALGDSVEFPEPLPAPVSLRIEAGGTAQQFQAMPGRMQVRSTFNFSAYANASGSIGMSAFEVTIGGRRARVPEAKLTVLPTREPQPAVELLFDSLPAEVYVGQTVVARLLLPDSGDGTVAAMTQPRVSGESLLLDGGYGRLTRHVVQRNGRPMAAFATELPFTPMRPGPLRLIGQASVILGRSAPGQYSLVPGYYPLFDTEPAMLSVRRVPDEGRLPGFTGAIGRLAADPPELTSKTARAGEPIRMRVIVRGEANFRRFTAPEPAPSADWRSYAADTEVGAATQADRPGFIVFNYVLVAQSAKARATPVIPFSYFDPQSRSYVDATIPSVAVEITGSEYVAVTGRTSLGPEDSVAMEESDEEPEPELAALMTKRGAKCSLEPLQGSAALLWLQLVPAALLGGLWAWDRRRRHLAANPWIIVRRRAVRASRAALRRAAVAHRRGDEHEYLEAVTLALREAAAPLMDAEAGALVGRDVSGEWAHAAEHEESDAALAGIAIERQFAARDRERFSGAVVAKRGSLWAEGAQAEAAARELIGRLTR